MVSSIALACGDLFDRRILAIAAKSLAITIGIFAGLALLLSWCLAGTDPCDWIAAGSCPLDGTASTFGGIAVTLLATWFLFPAVALGVLAAYSDKIVAAVEARHYPESLASARPMGAMGLALLGLRSSGRLLIANLIALPFYVILLVTGIGPLVLFVLVNGWAVGRDFGEMVALRHGAKDIRRSWLHNSRAERTGVGILAACLFLVPFLNFLAPIVGAAAVTHIFHRGARKPR